MDEATRKALEGSIEKWKQIVAGNRADKGVTDCPLCALSHNLECKGCPVADEVQRAGCLGTPYYKWLETQEGRAFGYKFANREDRLEAAKAELAFLESLR